jgi:hypothetical protein
LKFTAFELGGALESCRKALETFQIFTIKPLAHWGRRQGCRRPNSSEGRCREWRRSGQRALETQGTPSGGLGKGRGWPEVGFPRRPRRRRRRSSSAKGFLARRAVKLWSNSCSRRRGSYWGGRIGRRRGGGMGSTATGAYRREGERRRGGSGGSPATGSGLGALVR